MSNLPHRPLRLVVGLGNPGHEYAATRHNAGFWWVEQAARSERVSLHAEARFHGLVGKSSAGLLFLLPQTFMNASGRSVASLARFYRIEPDEMLVVHDELDLLPGTARLKLGGGHGGHNGLKDIAAAMGTPAFWRLRIGIGHPGHRDAVAAWVLNPPRADESGLIERAMDRGLQSFPLMLKGDFSAAMLQLHTQAE